MQWSCRRTGRDRKQPTYGPGPYQQDNVSIASAKAEEGITSSMTEGASLSDIVVLLSQKNQVKVQRLLLAFRDFRAKSSSLILRKVSKPTNSHR